MRFHRVPAPESPRPPRLRVLCIGVLAGLAAIALAPVVGQGLLQSTAHYPRLPQQQLNRIPDSNQVNDINDRQAKKQSFEAANAERKKRIGEDSAKLLKLATDLKTEVDKTNKDTLSLNVIRKADEIEKLAHDVKEKMKLTVGAS
jgi:hypothetical protein